MEERALKRASTLILAALMACLLALPVHAASYYPISVEEYTYGPFDQLRIDKVYELSSSDDPANIPTEDFDRDGYHFTLLDVVKTDQAETDSKDYTEIVTLETDTKDMALIIQQMELSIDVTTEDGYSGTLMPDYPGITVEEAHNIATEVEDKVRDLYIKGTPIVTVHVEPYRGESVRSDGSC